jgi:lysyl-tRNA synthetase class 1
VPALLASCAARCRESLTELADAAFRRSAIRESDPKDVSNTASPRPAPAQAAPGADESWIEETVERVLKAFPAAPLYTCAAGISPSGTVHFGNFRDVATAFAIAQELALRGKPVRLLFSWDDYDRFRKVPRGVDPGFAQHIGKPLTAVPDPQGAFPSYARRFEAEFETAMTELGIALDYRYQTAEYASGRYDALIVKALQRRDKIADILLSFMSEKGKEAKGIDPVEYRETFYPVSVYSRFSGTDKVEILGYDGDSKLTYKCLVTGNAETIDIFSDRIVKLAWKVDWPMRWSVEGVHFEPGGHDHASPGGSYDVSSVIVREIFETEPPVFQGYQFIGLQGGASKMSGSKGDAVSPATLLQIYEPAILKWLYLRRSPEQSFNLAFDSEIYRQYDEFDRTVAGLAKGTASGNTRKILAFAGVEPGEREPFPFRQAVALGQITQWSEAKLAALLEKTGAAYDTGSIRRRLPKAKAWLEQYNPDQMISLLPEVNAAYVAAMDKPARERVRKLREFLEQPVDSVASLDDKVYEIPKAAGLSEQETKLAQRAFFKDVYNLLIGKETGPRLSTFLWAVDRARVLELLTI